jgi:hypothetical protein
MQVRKAIGTFRLSIFTRDADHLRVGSRGNGSNGTLPVAVSRSQESKTPWICSAGRNFGTLDSDHVAIAGTHAARSVSIAPRWSKCRRKERSAVPTSVTYLPLMRSACRFTNPAISLAHSSRRTLSAKAASNPLVSWCRDAAEESGAVQLNPIWQTVTRIQRNMFGELPVLKS